MAKKKVFRIIILLISAGYIFLSVYSMQEKPMNDIFHYNSFSIGVPGNRYSGQYPLIPLRKSEDFHEVKTINMIPGYFAIYANRLRNSNTYTDIQIPPKAVLKAIKVNDAEIEAIYNCENNLLIRERGQWVLFSTTGSKVIAKGNQRENNCRFYSSDKGFSFFDNTLKIFSKDGKLLNNISLTLGSDLDRHEVAVIEDHIISAGYIAPGAFPDGPVKIQPAAQLESFKKEGLPEVEDTYEIQRILNSNLISFLQDFTLIPVYLDSQIIQPMVNKIAIFSYDLKVIKVLEGEFKPVALSAGRNSFLYMASVEDDKNILSAFDTEGNIIFKTAVPVMLGDCLYPPPVSDNGDIYWIGKTGIGAYNNDGMLIWEKFHNPVKQIYPLLYNNILTISRESGCSAYNNEGKTLFNLQVSGINTPLIPGKDGRYYLGTNSGLFAITIRP
jgi:hypothetical protein